MPRLYVFCNKFLIKETFSDLELKMSGTIALFFQTILYRLGYCSFKIVVPSHVSSQNLICLPSCMLKFPILRKSSLTFIRPLQNCESLGFLITCVIALHPKYLFLISCCHAPSELIKLKSHLLRRHLFYSSRFSTPSPP
jgi:hypothetical protein